MPNVSKETASVHYAGAEIVEFSPGTLAETIPVVMRNLEAAGVEAGART